MSTEILVVLVAALVLDRIVGDPDWLWRRLPHPVVLFGADDRLVRQGLQSQASG